MAFAFAYSCLPVLLDLLDVRVRVKDPEAELLVLRHQLRVLRRHLARPKLQAGDRAILAAFSQLVPRPSLSFLVQPETVLG